MWTEMPKSNVRCANACGCCVLKFTRLFSGCCNLQYIWSCKRLESTQDEHPCHPYILYKFQKFSNHHVHSHLNNIKNAFRLSTICHSTAPYQPHIQHDPLLSKTLPSGCPNHLTSGHGSSSRAQILRYRSMSRR